MLLSAPWLPFAVVFFSVSLALLLWILLTRLFCKSQWSRKVSANSALAIYTTLYVLLASELLLGVFFDQSNGFGVTLAQRKWVNKYWNPINSYGYRDYEHVWTDRVLFMVGDSYPAGHGIERVEDRMSAVLARKLGSRWTVATVAQPGWDSRAEFAALVAHPKIPNIIIVSYVFNDIEGVASQHIPTPKVVPYPPASIKLLVENSHLLNWFYWRLATIRASDNYFSYVKSAYASPEIFAEHMDDLFKFMDHAKKIGARVYFLIWPVLRDVNGGAEMIGKLTAGLREHDAQVIDLLPYLKDRPRHDLVVNQSDAHPNARIHAEAAEVIFERLAKDGLVRGDK